jgi:hypothetical protein
MIAKEWSMSRPGDRRDGDGPHPRTRLHPLPVIHRRVVASNRDQVSSLTVGRCSPTQATSTRPSLTTS